MTQAIHPAAIALSMLALLVLPVAGAFHSTLPVIAERTGDGDAGWGLQVDRGDTGEIMIELAGTGPATGQVVSGGVAVLDAADEIAFMVAFTAHSSPDRLLLPGAGATGTSTTPTHVAGDRTELPFELTHQASTAEAGNGCTFFCLSVSLLDAEPGAHRFVAWVGGVQATELVVRGPGQAQALVTQGEAKVAGDQELQGGTLNAQAQRTENGQALGAAAIAGAHHTMDVTGSLWGFWAVSEFKVICQFTVGQCAPTGTAYSMCDSRAQLWLDRTCRTTQISWQGPAESGTGERIHVFEGNTTGSYTFTVDHELDAYGPAVFDEATGTWVHLGEQHTYLSVADVELP